MQQCYLTQDSYIPEPPSYCRAIGKKTIKSNCAYVNDYNFHIRYLKAAFFTLSQSTIRFGLTFVLQLLMACTWLSMTIMIAHKSSPILPFSTSYVAVTMYILNLSHINSLRRELCPRSNLLIDDLVGWCRVRTEHKFEICYTIRWLLEHVTATVYLFMVQSQSRRTITPLTTMDGEYSIYTGVKNTFGNVDYVLFGSLLAVSTGIGVFYAFKDKHNVNSKDYLLGGRQMNIVPVSLSILVTSFSATTLLGMPAEVYNYNTMIWWLCISAMIGLVISSVVFVPFFYNLNVTSIYEVRQEFMYYQFCYA